MSDDAPARDAVLLCFERDRGPAEALGARLDLSPKTIERHRFPDGELRLRLPPSLPPTVIVFATLDQPNEKLIELLLVARESRALGAGGLVLVAPYLCYMRQDVAFSPGEAVSQRIVGAFLAELFDGVLTVDPHLHRTATLARAVPARRALALSAAPLIGTFVASQRPGALLIGPDAESAPWVEAAASRAGLDFAVGAKTRHGDRAVDVVLPEVPVAGRDVVLVDDMASTGRTLAQAARLLREAGAARVDAAVTHALFVGDAQEVMRAAGVAEIWSTDSIAHRTNRIALAPLLAGALRDDGAVRADTQDRAPS